MKVHLSKIANHIRVQGPGLISLLKKTMSVIPTVRVRGPRGRAYWSHHLRAVGADDRTDKNTTIRVGPTHMKSWANPIRNHEITFILTLGGENASVVAWARRGSRRRVACRSPSLWEEMVILDLKDERNGSHWRHKRLREGRLVSRPQPWLVFIA
jgi:hypothetical protein